MRSLLFIEQFSSITPLNFYNQLQVTKDIVVKVTSAGNKIADARFSRGRNPHYQGLTRPHSTRAADSWRLSHGGFPGGNSCWKAAATRLPFFVNCQHERKKIPSQQRRRTALPAAQLVRRSRARAFKFPASPLGRPAENEHIHSATFGHIKKS